MDSVHIKPHIHEANLGAAFSTLVSGHSRYGELLSGRGLTYNHENLVSNLGHDELLL